MLTGKPRRVAIVAASRTPFARSGTAYAKLSNKTIQNLDIFRVDEARQLLMIRGAVPGSNGGFLTVRPAIKAKKGAN